MRRHSGHHPGIGGGSQYEDAEPSANFTRSREGMENMTKAAGFVVSEAPEVDQHPTSDAIHEQERSRPTRYVEGITSSGSQLVRNYPSTRGDSGRTGSFTIPNAYYSPHPRNYIDYPTVPRRDVERKRERKRDAWRDCR
eukprot:1389464-Amorphochlora_amoeboformis.AAC.1